MIRSPWTWPETKQKIAALSQRVGKASGIKALMLAEIVSGKRMPTPSWRLAHHAIDCASIWMEELDLLARPKRAPRRLMRLNRVWVLIVTIRDSLDLALKLLRQQNILP